LTALPRKIGSLHFAEEIEFERMAFPKRRCALGSPPQSVIGDRNSR